MILPSGNITRCKKVKRNVFLQVNMQCISFVIIYQSTSLSEFLLYCQYNYFFYLLLDFTSWVVTSISVLLKNSGSLAGWKSQTHQDNFFFKCVYLCSVNHNFLNQSSLNTRLKQFSRHFWGSSEKEWYLFCYGSKWSNLENY